MHLLFTSTNPILQCVSSASEGEKNTESSRVCEAQRYSKEMGERKREILQNSRDWGDRQAVVSIASTRSLGTSPQSSPEQMSNYKTTNANASDKSFWMETQQVHRGKWFKYLWIKCKHLKPQSKPANVAFTLRPNSINTGASLNSKAKSLLDRAVEPEFVQIRARPISSDFFSALPTKTMFQDPDVGARLYWISVYYNALLDLPRRSSRTCSNGR